MNDEKDYLFELILKASEMGANQLEIEYKDGYEEISALSGGKGYGIGYGIDRLKSNTDKAKRLRERIHELKRRKRVTISGEAYDLHISIYDSFGEEAYKIKFRKR